MKREEAIKLLKQYQGYEPMFPDGETLKHAFDLTDETVDTLLTALRPVSRERVERMRGEWIVKHDKYNEITITECSKCGDETVYEFFFEENDSNFCPHCGAPMTDEAVEMVMERINEMEEMKK